MSVDTHYHSPSDFHYQAQLKQLTKDMLQNRIAGIFFSRGLTFEHMDFVLDSYSEPWRHYHNCAHILKMHNILLETDCTLLSDEELFAIELMFIYHDVIIKIGREKGWSERESAVVASKQLRYFESNMRPLFVDMVLEGILATINHEVPEKAWNHFIGLFLDIDLLAGLGTCAEEFEAKGERSRLPRQPRARACPDA